MSAKSKTEADQQKRYYEAAAEWCDGVIELSEARFFKALEIALHGHGCDDFLARHGRQAKEGAGNWR